MAARVPVGGRAGAPCEEGVPDGMPAVYRAGYEKARADDRDAATNYVKHTLIGDPAADAVVEALAPFDQAEAHRFIQAGKFA